MTQLAALFAGDALEWKAAQQAAAAEQTADAAATNPADPLPLLAEGLEYLGLTNTPELDPTEAETSAAPEASESEAPAEATPADATVPPDGATAETVADEAQPAGSTIDPEAEAKRIARARERDIKSILKQLLDELIDDYATDSRGVEIREIAGGYRMATKPECHDAVRLFVKSLKPPMKLSLPALETLAVVAYKQPVTSPEVSEIRGVESGGVLGSLLARKLIATAGRKQVIGRPILYKTTKEFLLRFGLKDLGELPSMEEFEKMAAAEIEELEPEAVAADAAQSAAELEDNSPSGEELAEAAAATEMDAASADEPDPDGWPESSQHPMESPTSNEPEPAPDTTAEAAGSAPEPLAAAEHPPAQPHDENEAVLHAQRDKEDR
jgi:segregation and condensation protein B